MYKFSAEDIPTCWNPFLIISCLLQKLSYIDLIHSAPNGFITHKRRSKGCKSLTSTCLSCSNICCEYHSWSSCLRKSLAGLFTLTSRGWVDPCNSVEHGQKWYCFCQSKSQHAWVICPLNSSNIPRVTWKVHYASIPVLEKRNNNLRDVIDHSCFIAPVIVRMSNAPIFRKLGWHWLVLPWYTSCRGKNSPLIVPSNITVICLLSSRPLISTFLVPSFPTIQLDRRTYFNPN